MAAINVGALVSGAKGRGLGFSARMMNRASGRALSLRSAYQAGGAGFAWAQGGAGITKGAMLGAGIGAGLNMGMSLIDQANSGNYSAGRTLGAGLRGGLMGGAAGAAFGAGQFFFGSGNPMRPTGFAPSARAATQASRGGFKDFMTRRRGLNNLSGVPRDPFRPTRANRRAAQREVNNYMNAGKPTWSQRNIPTFSRAGTRGLDKALQWNARGGYVDRGIGGLDSFLRWNAKSSAGGMARSVGRTAARPVDRVLQANARSSIAGATPAEWLGIAAASSGAGITAGYGLARHWFGF